MAIAWSDFERLRGIKHHRQDYARAKELAHDLDQKLGFFEDRDLAPLKPQAETPELGDSHSSGEPEQTWSHLSADLFQTPYSELCDMVEHLNLRGKSWCDLGAAFGRLGLVLHAFDPSSRYLGFEIVESRVKTAQRVFKDHGLDPHSILAQNLLTLSPSDLTDFDVFYCFDLGLRRSMQSILGSIRESTEIRKRPIICIARGRQSREVIEHEHPWLSQIIAAEHFDHFSVYRSESET
jgi:hypothetical protein